MSGRQVFFGPESGKLNTEEYKSNQITTARYNVLTFVPVQLFEQFKKVANIYFLFIGLLQQVPGLSPTGQFTTIGPLAIFITLSMIRELYDDVIRHRQDRRENERETQVLAGNVICCSFFLTFLLNLLINLLFILLFPNRNGGTRSGDMSVWVTWSRLRRMRRCRPTCCC